MLATCPELPQQVRVYQLKKIISLILNILVPCQLIVRDDYAATVGECGPKS